MLSLAGAGGSGLVEEAYFALDLKNGVSLGSSFQTQGRVYAKAQGSDSLWESKFLTHTGGR